MASRDFLIVDYTLSMKEGNEPTLIRVDLKELLEKISVARREDTIKIVVYEIGDCIVDWS